MFPNWEDCTEEQKEQRRRNFGELRDHNKEWSSYDAELVRRLLNGEYLTKADRRRANSLNRTARD